MVSCPTFLLLTVVIPNAHKNQSQATVSPMHALIPERPSDIWGIIQLSTSTSEHIKTSTCKKKKKIANCSFVCCLKIPTVGRLSEHRVSLEQWKLSVWGKISHQEDYTIGLSNCRREMQIFDRSTFKGTCPNSVSSFQLLENVAPKLYSW